MSQIDFTNVNDKTKTELKKQLDKIVKDKFDLVQSPVIVERVDIGGKRYYTPLDSVWEELGEKGEKPLFKSITTISNRMDKGVGFHKWLGDSTSFEDAMAYARLRATIGTIVHVLVTDLLLGDKIIFDDLTLLEHPDLKDVENVNTVYRKHKKEVIKYLMSFRAFWEERDPAPLALEIPLMNLDKDDNGDWKYPFSGTIDFIGSIKSKYNKIGVALLDWKSGNPYPRENSLQVIAGKLLWESHYPEVPIQYLASVYLKSNWRNKPSYSIKWYDFRPELWQVALLNDQMLNYLDKPNLEIGEWYQPSLPIELPTSITLKKELEETLK